jgi:hypothetical protein
MKFSLRFDLSICHPPWLKRNQRIVEDDLTLRNVLPNASMMDMVGISIPTEMQERNT